MRVLVVEDDVKMASLLKRGLEREGYAVDIAATGNLRSATLSFLGLGVVPPTPSWGGMLADSLQYYQVAWWFVLFPGLALLATTLSFNLLGDSVRDALDPNADRLQRRP